jgi:hypothetical protein
VGEAGDERRGRGTGGGGEKGGVSEEEGYSKQNAMNEVGEGMLSCTRLSEYGDGCWTSWNPMRRRTPYVCKRIFKYGGGTS